MIFDGTQKTIGKGAQAEVVSYYGYAYKIYRSSYPTEWIAFEKKQQEAVNKTGLTEILDKIYEYFELVQGNGYYQRKRREQSRFWMYESINESLKNSFYENPMVEKLLPEYEQAVLDGKFESFAAATELFEKFQENKTF